VFFQSAIAFLIWVAYGYYQSRRPEQVRRISERIKREYRGPVAALLLMAAVAALFLGLNLVVLAGGFKSDGLAIWAWVAVVAIGLMFVHLQTLALALIVSVVQESVTASRLSASSSQEESERE